MLLRQLVLGYAYSLNSLKYRNVVKVAIYYEMIYFFTNAAQPTKIDVFNQRNADVIMNALNFMLCAFDWWPSFIASQVTLIPGAINRIVYWEDDASEILMGTVMTMVWQSWILLSCHLILSKAGWIFIESDFLRHGNE